MTFTVVFSEVAAHDFEALSGFALQRELNSETGNLDLHARMFQATEDAAGDPPSSGCVSF